MTPSVFAVPPSRIRRDEVAVMQRSTADELPRIQALWPEFEELVGLRGRKMYAVVDVPAHTYTVCTSVRDDDDPERLGLNRGILPGGTFLRGRLVGEPPAVYAHIGAGVQELLAATPTDATRPVVEYYRRHDEIELWVPVAD